MKPFLKNLIHDIVLWALLASCLLKAPHSQYAENALSFYGVFLLVMGVLVLFASSSVSKKMADKSDYSPRGKLHTGYCVVTSLIEVLVMASMGWYWVASGFLVYGISILVVRSSADDIYLAKQL